MLPPANHSTLFCEDTWTHLREPHGENEGVFLFIARQQKEVRNTRQTLRVHHWSQGFCKTECWCRERTKFFQGLICTISKSGYGKCYTLSFKFMTPSLGSHQVFIRSLFFESLSGAHQVLIRFSERLKHEDVERRLDLHQSMSMHYYILFIGLLWIFHWLILIWAMALSDNQTVSEECSWEVDLVILMLVAIHYPTQILISVKAW